KACQIRRDLSRTEGYQANIKHAQSSVTNTESTLSHMEELIQEAKVKIMIGSTGTSSGDERKIVATELRSIQNQLLQSLNSQASDVYYFGGSNTDEAPFTLDANGKLEYNGILLSTNIATEMDTLNDYRKDSMYVDIGLGLRMNGTDVDRGSVFQYSIPGINVVGSGTTTLEDNTVVSNNLYDLLGQIATELESGSYSTSVVNELSGKLNEAAKEIIYNMTEVGSRNSYLEFMADRFETRTLDLQENQVNVEGADPASTIIRFKSQEVAYNAALQMGTKIIQPSIFDFMS
ncbi:MAG: hypothetical protein PHC91_00875, partial [Eubacteriales bacterium]|nr:hypothetical protein [Eubacteriales bacterium]